MKRVKYTEPTVCVCRKCNGSGSVVRWDYDRTEKYTEVCSQCEGSGWVKVRKKVEIYIDPHIPEDGDSG